MLKMGQTCFFKKLSTYSFCFHSHPSFWWVLPRLRNPLKKQDLFFLRKSHPHISVLELNHTEQASNFFLGTLRYCIPLLWAFTWINDTERVSLPSWCLQNPERVFWAMPARELVNERCGITFSACLLRLGTPPNCLLHPEFKKKKCQSVAFKTSLSLDLLITSFRNSYLIQWFTCSTVLLFLRIPENCWCSCNCSTLVSLFVGLAPSFVADALNFALGLLSVLPRFKLVPSLEPLHFFS